MELISYDMFIIQWYYLNTIYFYISLFILGLKSFIITRFTKELLQKTNYNYLGFEILPYLNKKITLKTVAEK